MFFNAPGNLMKIKRFAYLSASTFLGVLLAFLGHAIIEMSYLNCMAGQGRIVVFYGGCALHPLIQAIIWLMGIVGGFFLGRFWWRKVYVERVWANER